MSLVSASVDWMEGYANDPKLIITVDTIPSKDDLIYRQSKIEPNIWFAEHDGYVSFYSWSGRGNDGGFYGDTYVINTPGGKISLLGPFSSRAGAVNQTEFTECVDVVLRTEGRKSGGLAGAVTLDFARKAASSIGVDLVETYPSKRSPGERIWVPARRDES